jgi:two-component system, chemotaxis family, CheB/CheR fusion protein
MKVNHKTVKKVVIELPLEKPQNSLGPVIENDFPIVGIGASAGGLAAFESFFSGMPLEADTGMAFVLVQHLAPDHKSILTDLIRHYTRMQVFEVEDGIEVKPNCAYIIPPNCEMAFQNHQLRLFEPAAPHGQRLPIDFFFRSLAQDQHEKAIGLVLSGSGSDGTQGVRAIAAEGGLVIAQTPASTEYDSMPRSALATGLVDYELRPAEMVAQIMAFVTRDPDNWRSPAFTSTATAAKSLKKICLLLRSKTGHDFSLYKTNTLHRRIARRMAASQTNDLEQYITHLQKTPDEIEALFQDLLIGVTSFFRDPEAFRALEEQVIPTLCAHKPEGTVIRVWSPGCSSGEEAFSIAILLKEYLEKSAGNFKIQIFATDIDSQAIAVARAGVYSSSITEVISPKRLERFFTTEAGGQNYRIHKDIRDLIVFSEQDVIKDPPFSKIDLISCRNLLIYMSGELQKKLIPILYYALNPGGFLFLGRSETVGEFSDMFDPFSPKLMLFQRAENVSSQRKLSIGHYMLSLVGQETTAQLIGAKSATSRKFPWRELIESELLKEMSSTAFLINKAGDILYLYGRSGRYLELTPGEPGVNNILKMAREGLQRHLSTALHKAEMDRETVHLTGLRVKTNGDFTSVDLTIRKVESTNGEPSPEPLYLVILDEKQTAFHEQSQQGPSSTSAGVEESPDPSGLNPLEAAALRQELKAKEEYLQKAIDELETTNEELNSSNEEMQSINEEMRSTNEELETTKEELQSINEELTIVNTELQNKLVDLARVNNDMNNLLSGTNIATIFVDLELHILRFTPAAKEIINLIPGDVGRPIGHILSNLKGYATLVEDIRVVLKTLVPCKKKVLTLDGSWYTLSIQPYRTLDNTIEGAVITFMDISEIKRAEAKMIELEALKVINQAKNELLANVSHELRTPLTSIKGYIETLIEPDVKWKKKQKLEFLNLANKETDRLLLLIRDLLDMSRIESGKMVLDKQIYHLNEILDSAGGVLSIIAAKHKLAICLAPDLPPLRADKVRLVQVITNLVENATKFSSEESPISIEAKSREGSLDISVEDHGIGMSPEVVTKLFDRFYQANRVVTGKIRGTGLGLAICRGIVEAHGGHISVESQEGQGSKFIVNLPCSDQ